jgi:hypothetical protein
MPGSGALAAMSGSGRAKAAYPKQVIQPARRDRLNRELAAPRSKPQPRLEAMKPHTRAPPKYACAHRGPSS